jgi:prepilin-type N-terminal cleavage/methylation domain-containing protein
MMKKHGFTLIEMSIVLVIIGLIIGGVLVGRDLISAAQVRAQISQIEKYNAAVNTFRGKYGYLPGDMPQTPVTQFGFTAAPTRPGIDSNGSLGLGNGDGVLEGSGFIGNSSAGWTQGGETFWFWEDLSTNSGLIEGGFNSATNAATNPNPLIGLSIVGQYLPVGKIGSNFSVMVGSTNNLNYYFVAVLDTMNGGGCTVSTVPCITSGLAVSSRTIAMSSATAFAFDSKTDDGLAASGNVQYAYLGGGNPLVIGTGALYAGNCFNTATNQYSPPASGVGICNLAIKMQ